MKKYFLLLLSTVFLPTIVFAYTSPGQPQGLVSDFAGLLSATTRDNLEQTLRAYEQSTSRQIAVATINELKDETIETYATRLFEEYGIGQKGKDNGVLFLISKNDRQMRIEVGYGLEGDLTDIEAKKIINNIATPAFKSGNFDGGVTASVNGILSAIDNSDLSGATSSKSNAGWIERNLLSVFWLGGVIFAWLAAIFARSRSWWLGGVVGGVAGVVIWLIWTVWLWLPALVIFGLIFDYLVSKKYQQAKTAGLTSHSLWWMGGGTNRWDKGGGGFGGFGGFGGGSSGGGGASGRW